MKDEKSNPLLKGLTSNCVKLIPNSSLKKEEADKSICIDFGVWMWEKKLAAECIAVFVTQDGDFARLMQEYRSIKALKYSILVAPEKHHGTNAALCNCCDAW